MARPPKAPAYLDEIAVEQWETKAKHLAKRKDLMPADWNSLELYCVNYSIYRKAVADLAVRGFTVEGERGAATSNPALKAKSDAERIMIKMSSLLGFDTVSRNRHPVSTEKKDGLSALE
ncbi:phage terminase small subunit P27 family [Erwinia psidii]|uniref:Phage terminase small subunit P27 family n=1 Tax=Erwinia psidii TaxID=69224 RepID=A0A3N6TNT4_9GAMM|nr:phage terminase small subunit P27 family [Erwinia psidii]MCX8959435.1 phage terminase small subunit P27 family [Erwinia psidii]RQM36882.1 phage terminase small subunit P27 family [Erwinia psidii]